MWPARRKARAALAVRVAGVRSAARIVDESMVMMNRKSLMGIIRNGRVA